MTPLTVLLFGLAAVVLDASAVPEDKQAKPREKEANEVDGLTIEAERRGRVDTPIEPELILGEEEIRSLGASSLADLMAKLAPQLQGGRDSGPPVMLINGRRISGMQETVGIPPEASLRVEVYPEEVAVSLGYKPGQRVVNTILKKHFNSKMVEGLARVATQDGGTISTLLGNRLSIDGDRRWSLDGSFQHQPQILEADRDIVRSPGGQPFDRAGNIVGLGGAEIDPALSALAGSTVTFAGVPTTAANGRATLADFTALAGRYNTGDLTSGRGLRPASDRLTLRGTRTSEVGRQTLLTLTANLEDTRTKFLLGLPGMTFTLPAGSPFSPFANAVSGYRYIDAPGAMTQESEILRTQLAFAANGRLGGWRWAANGDLDRIVSDTTTERGLDATAFRAAVAAGDPAVNPFGPIAPALYKAAAPDTAHSVSTLASAALVMDGTVLETPAGDVQAMVKLALDSQGLDSKTVRSGVTTTRDVSRDQQSIKAQISLPLTSTRRKVMAKLGDLSVNAGAEYEELSDRGGLTSLSGGLNWRTPLKGLSFVASHAEEQGAPTTTQINAPLVVTPSVPVFDFNTGQTVLVSQSRGGNPALRNGTRAVSRLTAQYRPFEKLTFFVNATYQHDETRNMIAEFPGITPDLEAAFPERFTRDATGRLLAIDARPVNFARAAGDQIRWGFMLSKAVGAPIPGAVARPGGPGGMMQMGPPPGGGGPGSGGLGGGPGMGMAGPAMGPGLAIRPGQGVLMVLVNHTWRLSDEITVRDGLPILNQLDGAAISSRTGMARHEISAQGNYFRNGRGVDVNLTWKGKTWVNGGATGGQTLYFSDLASVRIGAFADLNQTHKALVAKSPWLKNARVGINVENLFDARQRVRDQNGETPQAYQRDRMDPLGRTIRISFRKLIF